MRRASLLVVSLAMLGLLVARPGWAQEAAETETPDGDIPGLETFEVDSHLHAEGQVDYPQEPPAGGRHHAIWQDCGFYTEPVRNEHAVHSLEHGAVWITYQIDLPEDDLGILRELAERNRHVLVSPYPDLPVPIVASAWGAQLRLDDADDRRLRLFVRAYARAGPERGAPCFGGTAETIPLPVDAPVASPAAPAGTPAADAG